ncbi:MULTISPECIES: hypothetical protein [Streptomyces]|nr:hypothetical protein [Streptomyces canarius]
MQPIQKTSQRVKARMDQRTRERLPVLPTVVGVPQTRMTLWSV